MTAEETVLGGYAAFGQGNIEAFAKLFHPECKVIVNGKHALSGEYIGFDAFNEGNLSKLNNAYPGMGMDIEKVVSSDPDVVVFLKVTYQNSVARAVHHFVVQDGLLMEFNVHDDSQLAAEAIQI